MYFKRFFFPSQFLGEGKELLGSTTIVRESPRKKLVPHSYRTKHVFGLFGKRRKNPGEVRSAVFFYFWLSPVTKSRHKAHLLYVPIQAMGRPRFL